MYRIMLLSLLGICGLSAQEPSRKLWKVSLLSMAAAQTADIHSSWGKHELNPTLAGPNGNFGARGALLKIGLQGTLAGVEYLITRHRPSPRLYRALTWINFGAAAATSASAARNYTVPRPVR